jgi:hypothetical protein
MADNYKRKRAYSIGGGGLTAFQEPPIVTTRAPLTTDVNYPIGQVWINQSTDVTYSLTKVVAGSATWGLLGPGSTEIDTINGLSPVAGNIIIDGGTNITDSNAGNTVTLNLDAAITLATSVTAPLYTAAAGLAITAAAANDITIKMGDALGAQKISFTDSADAEQASLDSDGTLTVVNLDGIIGATTPAAITGTTIVANTSVTSPIYTSTGAVDTAINAVAGQDIIIKMGDAAGAQKVSFVDSADAEVASIDSNGGLTTTAITFTGLLTASASATIETAGTALTLAADNSGDAVILGGGTVARAITIGQDAAAHTVAIGQAAAGAITIDTAAGLSIGTATASDWTSSLAGATDYGITLEASAADGKIQIKAGTLGIEIGNEADTSVIDIGDFAPTASRTITVGGGTVVTAATTDTIDIGPDGATTNADSVKTVNVNTGGVTTGQVLTNIASGAVTSGTHTVSIQTGNVAAGTVAANISTGTGTKTVNVGNADALTTVNIDAALAINTDVNAAVLINTGTSTGAVTIGAIANSGAVAVESSTTIDVDAAGAVSINSTGAALNFGNDDVDQAVNVGTDGERTVTVGSTNGAASLVLQSGSGEITVSGTVKEINAEFLSSSGDDITFQESPICLLSGNAPALPTGATGTVNLLGFRNLQMEQFILGAGQTIIAPVMTASGLLVSGDLTATEGFEYNWGAALSTSRHTFTIGTDAAFFLEWEFTVADVAGASPYMCGFRKVEANNATLTSYTDYAMIGLDAVASLGNVVIKTELNSGGTTNTNTTDAWNNGETHSVTVLVSAAGVVTYLIDGVDPSATAAFTFDNGDQIAPFFRLLHDAGGPGAVHWNSMKCGYQA